MNKKEMVEALRSIKMHNDWNVVENGHPMIHYSRQHNNRSPIPDNVMLTVKGKTFKGAAWYDNGSKRFSGGDTKEQFQAAMAWVEKNFPGMKMVKSPFDNSPFSVIPEEDLNKALALVKGTEKEKVKELKVFGGSDIIGGIQYRLIVAASSMAQVARLTNTPKSRIRSHWATTANKAEVDLANSKPGTIFIQGLNDYNGAWAELAK